MGCFNGWKIIFSLITANTTRIPSQILIFFIYFIGTIFFRELPEKERIMHKLNHASFKRSKREAIIQQPSVRLREMYRVYMVFRDRLLLPRLSYSFVLFSLLLFSPSFSTHEFEAAESNRSHRSYAIWSCRLRTSMCVCSSVTAMGATCRYFFARRHSLRRPKLRRSGPIDRRHSPGSPDSRWWIQKLVCWCVASVLFETVSRRSARPQLSLFRESRCNRPPWRVTSTRTISCSCIPRCVFCFVRLSIEASLYQTVD